MTLISKEELLDALYERFGEDLDNDTGCYVCTDNGREWLSVHRIINIINNCYEYEN